MSHSYFDYNLGFMSQRFLFFKWFSWMISFCSVNSHCSVKKQSFPNFTIVFHIFVSDLPSFFTQIFPSFETTFPFFWLT